MTTQAESQDALPFHLKGNYAPVTEEVSTDELSVKGTIPPELSGLYVRNGPNPASGSSGHWFLGDGMLHGVQIDNGRAAWYRNRWVQTRALNEPDAKMIDDFGQVDRTIGVSNTHVVSHAGRILALVESSFPCEVDPQLETIGVHDFDGKLDSAMTAHPKICPTTGEMHFFGYGFFAPFLTYNRVSAEGALVESKVIDVPGPTMIHDFAITKDHVIFMDLPVVFDLDLAMQGSMPYHWDDNYGARVGIMDRASTGSAGSIEKAGSSDVQWFEVDPCYVFHPMNAFVAEDGKVNVDTARYPSLWKANSSDFDNDAVLHRWTFDLANGTTAERQLDDRAVEFPRIPDSLVGLENTYGYAVASFEEANSLVKYDLSTFTGQAHDFGSSRVPGEAVFVPSADASNEDDGWLMAYVYDKPTATSSLVVLDARDMTADPVAEVDLPQRVPYGFHGSWIGSTNAS